MSVAMQINHMVEQLQESEQSLVLEIVRRFLPDDVATPDELLAIADARAEYWRGETVAMEDIDWD